MQKRCTFCGDVGRLRGDGLSRERAENQMLPELFLLFPRDTVPFAQVSSKWPRESRTDTDRYLRSLPNDRFGPLVSDAPGSHLNSPGMSVHVYVPSSVFESIWSSRWRRTISSKIACDPCAFFDQQAFPATRGPLEEDRTGLTDRQSDCAEVGGSAGDMNEGNRCDGRSGRGGSGL